MIDTEALAASAWTEQLLCTSRIMKTHTAWHPRAATLACLGSTLRRLSVCRRSSGAIGQPTVPGARNAASLASANLEVDRLQANAHTCSPPPPHPSLATFLHTHTLLVTFHPPSHQPRTTHRPPTTDNHAPINHSAHSPLSTYTPRYPRTTALDPVSLLQPFTHHPTSHTHDN